MVLYYAMTKFHLLFALTHHMTETKQEEAMIFLYKDMRDIDKYKENILNVGLFDYVKIIDEIAMRKGWMPVKSLDDDYAINNNVNQVCEEMDKWLPVPVSAFSAIFIPNDQWALGIYCICHHIPYFYVEDGVGMLSKPEYSYELVYRQNKSHAFLAKKIGAFGLNEYVIGKYADMKNQKDEYVDEKIIDYSVKERLSCLYKNSNDDLKRLVSVFYNGKCFRAKDDNTILFTEHFVNMKRLAIENQIELYTLLCDYFAEGSLLIKKHPNDIHTPYKKVLRDAEMLPRDVPSELLPYICNINFNIALTACSTSVLGLEDYFKKIVRFDINIEDTYYKFHLYYALIKILDCGNYYLAQQSVYEKKMFENFCSKYFSSKQTQEILLIDNDELSIELDTYDRVIVLRIPSHTNWSMIEKAINEEMICLIRIRKFLRPQATIINENSEYIIFYSKNKEEISEIKGLNMKKDLNYSGMSLQIDCVSDNEFIKNKMLEGMLKSANEEIARLLQQEKDLKNQIDTLKGL